MNPQLRIMLVDDHYLVRMGLTSVLSLERRYWGSAIGRVRLPDARSPSQRMRAENGASAAALRGRLERSGGGSTWPGAGGWPDSR